MPVPAQRATRRRRVPGRGGGAGISATGLQRGRLQRPAWRWRTTFEVRLRMSLAKCYLLTESTSISLRIAMVRVAR